MMMEKEGLLLELDARRQIRDAIVRFARGADRLDRAMMISAYHEDAWDDHGIFKGKPKELADWVVELHQTQFLWTAHYVQNELVEFRGNEAFAETHVQGVFRFERDGRFFDMMGFGRYLDRFELRDGKWKIIHRVATADWNRIDPVLEMPNSALVEELIHGTRTFDDPSYAYITC